MRRAVVAEWGTLFGTVREHVARKRFASIPLAVVATFLILLFSIVQHLPGRVVRHPDRRDQSRAAARRIAAAHPVVALRAGPGPAGLGALVQVLLVFGIAEIVLGRKATLFIAYACTLTGTIYARIGVRLGPEHLFGLPGAVAHMRDTGPSAAVVALAICIAWKSRAWFTGAAVMAAMLGEAVLVPNLAGQEHIVAIITAVLIAASGEVFGSYWPRVLTGVGAATLFSADRQRTA